MKKGAFLPALKIRGFLRSQALHSHVVTRWTVAVRRSQVAAFQKAFVNALADRGTLLRGGTPSDVPSANE